MAPISAKHFQSLARSARISRLKRSGCQISLPKHHVLLTERIETYTSHLKKARKRLHYSKLFIRSDEFDKLIALAAKLTHMLSYLFPRNSADDLPQISSRDAWAYPALMYARQEQFHSQTIFERCCEKYFRSLSTAQVITIGLSKNRGEHDEAKILLHIAQLNLQSGEGASMNGNEESIANAVEHTAFYETIIGEETKTDPDDKLGNGSIKQTTLQSRNWPKSEDDMPGAGALSVDVKLELDNKLNVVLGAENGPSESIETFEPASLLLETHDASAADKKNGCASQNFLQSGLLSTAQDNVVCSSTDAESSNEDSDEIEYKTITTTKTMKPEDQSQLFLRVHSTIRRLQKRKNW